MIEKILVDIVQKVEAQRLKLDLSQKELAQRANISYGTYRNFLDIHTISLEKFVKVLLALDLSDEIELISGNNISKSKTEIVVEKTVKKELVQGKDINLKIKRIVTFFDQERKKLQKNYVRKEYRNMDGEYLLRVHIKESNRTPEMFIDAVRWLFSSSPKAEFHRQYIMNIAKLIEHFNTLEHQAMYSKEEIKFNEEAQSWYNVYKKNGMSEEKIIAMLKEGGYIK